MRRATRAFLALLLFGVLAPAAIQAPDVDTAVADELRRYREEYGR